MKQQVADTIDVWNAGALPWPNSEQSYSRQQQMQNESAYDEALLTVEQEARSCPRSGAGRLETRDRILAAFSRFSTAALGLESRMNTLLTEDFLPVGTQLAQWARHFDPALSMADIIQACRNAWTACGLQPLLGLPVALTPSILGYSLLYPYSDNFLDSQTISGREKLEFSRRFRRLLLGEKRITDNLTEQALRVLVGLIESQYPRAHYPDVFASLLAIHHAQEQSIQQTSAQSCCDDAHLLYVSCCKGGTSVLADACLGRGYLNEQEARFAFEWGVLLQLGDDLQDIGEDLKLGSITLFSRMAASGKPLDGLTLQLLSFSERVAARLDAMPHGSPTLKQLLKMSWRSLIIRAVADSDLFFSKPFLKEAERRSPFRFAFLKERQARLAGNRGLYATLFEAFLEPNAEPDHVPRLPPSLTPHMLKECAFQSWAERSVSG